MFKSKTAGKGKTVNSNLVTFDTVATRETFADPFEEEETALFKVKAPKVMRNNLRDEVFGRNVVMKLQQLWQRVDDGNFIDREEENFLLEEIANYQEMCVLKLLKHRKATNELKPCCLSKQTDIPNEDDEDDASNDDVEMGKISTKESVQDDGDKGRSTVKRTHQERKKESDARRALFWQSLLELSNEFTDILLLPDLARDIPVLFQLSLIFLILALLGKLLTACWLRRRVDPVYRWNWYLVGTFISLVETNLGLYTIKKCLKDVEVSGREYLNLTDLQVHQKEKDAVSTAAANQLQAGYAEMGFIVSVTIVQDLPEFAIQIAYLVLFGQETGVFFWFAVVTTWIHFIFQTWEFLLTRQSVKTILPPMAYGREIKFDDSDKINQLIDSKLSEYSDGVRIIDLEGVRYIDHDALITIGAECKNLVAINLNQCIYIGLGGPGNDGIPIEPLFQCKHLTTVLLERTRVTDEEIEKLAESCEKLLEVRLKTCKYITDKAAVGLATFCRLLQVIDLSNTAVSDEGISAIADRCWDLRKAYFSNSPIIQNRKTLARKRENMKLNITLDSLRVLSINAWRLVELNFGGTHVNDEGINLISEGCSFLTIVYLDRTDVTDTGVELLCPRCVNLQILNLSFTKLNSRGMKAISDTCPKLKRLYIAKTDVKTEDIERLAKNCGQLQVLDVGRCKGVEERAILALARHCPNLESLKYSENIVDSIDNTNPEMASPLMRLARRCRELTVLDLSNTRVRDRDIKELVARCKLSLLDVTDCRGISDEVIEFLQAQGIGLISERNVRLL